MTDVKILSPEVFIDLLELSSDPIQTTEWWYECYRYLAYDEALSNYKAQNFIGRKVILNSNRSLIPPSDDKGTVICLPILDEGVSYEVPRCFSNVFSFIDSDLAQILDDGEEEVKQWVLDRFRIARFEASDLLPRAIGIASEEIFNGKFQLGLVDLLMGGFSLGVLLVIKVNY